MTNIDTEKQRNTKLAIETISQAAKHGNDDELANALTLTANAFKQQYNANCLLLPFRPKSSRFQRINRVWNQLQAKIVDPKKKEKNTFFFLPAETFVEVVVEAKLKATKTPRKHHKHNEEKAHTAQPATTPAQAEATAATSPKRTKTRKEKKRAPRKRVEQTRPGTPLTATAAYINALTVPAEGLSGMALLLKEAAAKRESAHA